ncbi:MAG: pilin [Candidatus Pacebacteria bacterium]|nr:pilin [Candidatus Paceibacterota bacterium]
MLKARQILAISAIILIFSGWSSLVWAIGKSCTNSNLANSNSNKNGCPANEKCCCCNSETKDCPGPTGNENGVCFPQKVSGSASDLSCKDVICPYSSHTSVKDFIDKAVSYVFYISVIMAPLMIVIGAFLFLTSAGNPKQSKSGMNIIKWTVIGFAIILFAKGITAIIKMILVG